MAISALVLTLTILTYRGESPAGKKEMAAEARSAKVSQAVPKIKIGIASSMDSELDYHPLLVDISYSITDSFTMGAYAGWERDTRLCKEESSHWAGLWEGNVVTECSGNVVRSGLAIGPQIFSESGVVALDLLLGVGWQYSTAHYVETTYRGSDLRRGEIDISATNEFVEVSNWEGSFRATVSLPLTEKIRLGPTAEIVARMGDGSDEYRYDSPDEYTIEGAIGIQFYFVPAIRSK